MDKIINRTPHPITILAADGTTVVRTLPKAARDEVARVETTTEPDGGIDGVPFMRTRWGSIVGLPAPSPGVWHVVSVIVAEAAIDSGRGADDLLVPGDQVRGPEGQIIGCRGLCRASSASPAHAGQRGYKVAMAMHRRTDPECDNIRPEPDALVIEAEYFVDAADRSREDESRQRNRWGISYMAGEIHGRLRTDLMRVVVRAVNEALATPAAMDLGAEEAVERVVSAVALDLAREYARLPRGRSGEEWAGEGKASLPYFLAPASK